MTAPRGRRAERSARGPRPCRARRAARAGVPRTRDGRRGAARVTRAPPPFRRVRPPSSPSRRSPMRTTPRSLLLAAVLLASAACGGDDHGGGGGPVAPIPYQDDGKLTVMTRNLYLGADLAPVIAAGADPTKFVTATTQAWAQAQQNNFGSPPARL